MSDFGNESYTDTTADPSQWQQIDATGDGAVDGVTGWLDGWGQVALIDADRDGNPDFFQVDTNGDGRVDFSVVRNGDNYTISNDSNYDGAADETVSLTGGQLADQFPDLWSLIGVDAGTAADVPVGPPVDNGQIIGDPWEFSGLWFEQSFNGYCAPSAVQQIYELYTGQTVSENAFIDLANQVGAWSVADGVPGMTTQGMVEVLSAAGIPTETSYDNSIDDLATALENDQPILIGIDSGEYWGTDVGPDNDAEADHEVIVTGIDTANNSVILSDTGTPDGNMLEVPMDVFMDAWADSGNEMVTVTTGVDDFQEGSDNPATDAGTGTTDGSPALDTSAGSPALDTSAGTPVTETPTDYVLSGDSGRVAPAADAANRAESPVPAGSGNVASGNFPFAPVLASSGSWHLLPVALGLTAAGSAFVKRASK